MKLAVAKQANENIFLYYIQQVERDTQCIYSAFDIFFRFVETLCTVVALSHTSLSKCMSEDGHGMRGLWGVWVPVRLDSIQA
jgi:hypothetical protein